MGIAVCTHNATKDSFSSINAISNDRFGKRAAAIEQKVCEILTINAQMALDSSNRRLGLDLGWIKRQKFSILLHQFSSTPSPTVARNRPSQSQV
jgi:hypothetical protein